MEGPKCLSRLLSGNLPAMFKTADLQTYCGYFLAVCQLCFYFAVNFVTTIWDHNHVRSSFCSLVHAISNELRAWLYFLFCMDHYVWTTDCSVCHTVWTTDCSPWFTHRSWAFNLPCFLYNRWACFHVLGPSLGSMCIFAWKFWAVVWPCGEALRSHWTLLAFYFCLQTIRLLNVCIFPLPSSVFKRCGECYFCSTSF